MSTICRPGLTILTMDENLSSHRADKGLSYLPEAEMPPLRVSAPNQEFYKYAPQPHKRFLFSFWIGVYLFCAESISFAQRNLQEIKKTGLKRQRRDVMGIISQMRQDSTMCWSLFKKAEKFPKDYIQLVSHFGKDFLCLLVLSIKIEPAGYNDIMNHVQKSSETEKKI